MDELFKEFLEETVMTLEKGMARLEIRSGPEDGRIFPITTEIVRIGRQLSENGSARSASVSAFVIRTDKAISREHCQLSDMGGGVFLLKDLDSRYGTEHNGEKVAAPVECRHGDTLLIGDTLLVLETEP